MMKQMIAFVFVLLIATASFAGHANCTAGMVSEGVCRNAANHVLFYDAPASVFAEIRDAIAVQQGWAATMECTDDLVKMRVCITGEIGTDVSVAKDDFAVGWVRKTIHDLTIKQEKQTEGQAAEDAVVDAVDVE